MAHSFSVSSWARQLSRLIGGQWETTGEPDLWGKGRDEVAHVRPEEWNNRGRQLVFVARKRNPEALTLFEPGKDIVRGRRLNTTATPLRPSDFFFSLPPPLGVPRRLRNVKRERRLGHFPPLTSETPPCPTFLIFHRRLLVLAAVSSPEGISPCEGHVVFDSTTRKLELIDV